MKQFEIFVSSWEMHLDLFFLKTYINLISAASLIYLHSVEQDEVYNKTFHYAKFIVFSMFLILIHEFPR